MKILIIAIGMMATIHLHAQSIKDLDFLIGKWKVSEIVAAGTDKEYTEIGARECSYYMGSWIKCETKGKRHGRNRSYTFLINYHPEKEYFQFLSLSSDYPDCGISAWIIDSDASIIRGRSTQGYESIHSINFEDKNKIIWQGLYPRANDDSKLELEPLWTETATRK
ncbi:MAG: hypothetical protein ABJP45_04265 [Cyclobacteriaceae bacterium]